MRRRFTSRGLPRLRSQAGYSILAALVFVAILSSAMVLTKYVVPQGSIASVRSQLASAEATYLNDAAPKSCSEAISQAVKNNGETGEVVSTARSGDAAKSGVVDSCFGAVVKVSSIGKTPKTENDFMCTGRAGTATVNLDGSIRMTTAASADVPTPGRCKITICNEQPLFQGARPDPKCSEPKLFENGQTLSAQAPAFPSQSGSALPGGGETVPGAQPQGGVTGGGALTDAYRPEEQRIRNDLDNIGNDNERLTGEIERLAGICGGEATESADSACVQVQQYRETLAANEARQQELSQQLNELRQSQASGILPTSADNIDNIDIRCVNGVCTAAAQNQTEREALRRNGFTCTAVEGGATCSRQQNTFTQRPGCEVLKNCQGDERPCSGGQVWNATTRSCVSPGGTGNPGPGSREDPNNREGGFPVSALGNFLQGLMRGLGGAAAAPAQQCASDPNAYQQQQQQYQTQLQQYNYQLQQYNYDVQRARAYGITPPPPPAAPTPCTPNQNQNTCPAAPPQPTSGCNGSWRPVTTQAQNGRQCTSNWQCVPSNATPPTAQMSCQPKVIDAGMSVAISYSCGNATGSTGTGPGFSTDNNTSGTSTAQVTEVPDDATRVNFALTCRNENLTARAECSVQIARPTIVLIANPRTVQAGESSRVGWVTSGMKSCEVWSPQMPGFSVANQSNTNINGTATTSPISRDTTVLLTCETIGGAEKEAYIDILVGNGTTTSAMTVSSSIDGKTDVEHGDTATVSWDAGTVSSGSVVELWLVDVASGHFTALIEGDLEPEGTYTWTLPTSSGSCSSNSSYVCHQDLIAGRSYRIQASLWTPSGGYVDDARTSQAFRMND